MAVAKKKTTEAGTVIQIGGVKVVVRPQPQRGQVSESRLRKAVRAAIAPAGK